MEGFLLIDKPKGWTSFDVVKYVRTAIARASGLPVKRVKVGHSGTLDPFATGLLILLIGKPYTVRANVLLKQDKSYTVQMVLDTASTTGDPEGVLTSLNGLAPPSEATLSQILDSFQGDSQQTPPIYSAIKVGGVRSYKLARDNKPVELEPRRVTIKNLSLLSYSYPIVEFQTEVSSGTYIRSLVEDIGKAMGRTAYTKQLRRTSIGACSIDQAYSTEQINEQTISKYLVKEL